MNKSLDEIRESMKKIYSIVFEAYKTSGNLLTLLDFSDTNQDAVGIALDKTAAQYESGLVMLRNLCESAHPGPAQIGTKPALPHMNISGRLEVNHYSWLHIELSALLPNCRFQTPVYLRDTITRLLDEYEKAGRALPRYDSAMLMIDEHCDIDSRQIFDQDNKGWKAIPNALKGRVIKDDDQFSLSIMLMSTRSKDTACHIYLIPGEDIADFFAVRSGNYPLFP